MVAFWSTRHLAQMLFSHPRILGQLADCALGRLAGHLTAHGGRGGIALVQTVERAMHAARRSGGRRLLRALGRAQGSRHVERRLGRADLARLQRQLVASGGGHARRGGRVVGGRVGGGGVGSRMAIDRDLAGSGGGGDGLGGGCRVRGHLGVSQQRRGRAAIYLIVPAGRQTGERRRGAREEEERRRGEEIGREERTASRLSEQASPSGR